MCPREVLMVFSTIWLFMPFINPMERIMAKMPKAIDEITTRERRLFLQMFLQPSIIRIFMTPSYSCRTASTGLSFAARLAGNTENSIAKTNVRSDVTATLVTVASAGIVDMETPHTAVSAAMEE